MILTNMILVCAIWVSETTLALFLPLNVSLNSLTEVPCCLDPSLVQERGQFPSVLMFLNYC